MANSKDCSEQRAGRKSACKAAVKGKKKREFFGKDCMLELGCTCTPPANVLTHIRGVNDFHRCI